MSFRPFKAVADRIYDLRMRDRLPPLSPEVKEINRHPPRMIPVIAERKKKRRQTLLRILIPFALLGVFALCARVYEHGGANGSGCTSDGMSPASPSARAVVSDGDFEIHCIDVGQGDCTLVRGGGADILIDASLEGCGRAIRSYLRREGVDRLELVVCTHPHNDHIGGMAEVLRSMPADRILTLPDGLPLETDWEYDELMPLIRLLGIDVVYAEQGDVFRFGGMTMTVLAPFADSAAYADYDGANDFSIALRFDCGKVSFFTGGDISATVERQLIDAGLVQPVTIYRASHHGSCYSSCGELLDALRPRRCCISCGADNDYGHPHKVLLDRLADRGIPVDRTDLGGSIAYRFTAAETGVADTGTNIPAAA